jgi:N-acetylglucosamine kinase-like BadF-type ATPase
MILVADSGSSKTDWLLALPEQEPLPFRTSGLNPYFLNEKEIIKILKEQTPQMIAYAPLVTEIYFFGAGCSSPDRHEIISNGISFLFKNAFISVDSDLLGCAYATCGHEKGLCCVLGTGSNISYFDGEHIHDSKHGLGYVLGDEGSGTWFGKKLITDFLYGNMPLEIAQLFYNEYKLDKETVISNVYRKSTPNSYLASFTRFLATIRKTAYGREIINQGFQEFIDTNIKDYAGYAQYKCHFVGSIAYIFADELLSLCKSNGVHPGKIIQQPINDLLQFILSRND